MKRRECLKKMICLPAAVGGGFNVIHPVKARPQGPTMDPAHETGFRFLTPPIIKWSTSSSFEVLAITNSPAICSLQYREKGGEKSFSTITNQEHGLITANETFHNINVSGLNRGKNYEYRLTARSIDEFEPYEVRFGSDIESRLYSVTLPDPGEEEIRFSVLNDLHKNIPLTHKLMRRIEESSAQPDLVMLNGDILSHIEGEKDVAAILNLPGKYASEHPLIWIRGNHECRGAFARYLHHYLAVPDGRFYYTFRQGPVQFLVLDNGEDKNDSDPEYSGLVDFESFRNKEEEWFKQVIKTPEWESAPFRILVSHIPVGHIPGDEGRNPKFFPTYKKRWASIMNQAGLDLGIAAHYHKYYLEDPSEKRTYPVVIGGGPREDSATIISVHASTKRLDLKVTNLKNEIIGKKSWPERTSSRQGK